MKIANLYSVLIVGAPGPAPSGLYLAASDRPARFHGPARIQLTDGSICIAAFRVEDIGGRDYYNRWHYIIQAANAAIWYPSARNCDGT